MSFIPVMKPFKSEVDSYLLKVLKLKQEILFHCSCSWFFISILPEFKQPAI